MINHAVDSLSLHRPPSRKAPLNGVTLQNIGPVQEKLLEELIELESLMERAEAGDQALDFSLVQTYKEMIHSRRQLYNSLSRHA